MPSPHERWVATVDERRGRIFRLTRTPRGNWHADEISPSLRSVWENDHERGRPTILNKGPGPVPTHDADFGHEQEEEGRRFARDVAAWLQKHAARTGDTTLVVFAAPRFLGFLRPELPKTDDTRLKLIQQELSRLRPDELADHPAVAEALALP